tara:strand:+ start:183 stop:797 length:615 start_codon:yes stop_codon:yes gene_type:complete
MSFPDIGVAIPGASAGSNIKFSQLRTSWGYSGESGYFNGSDPSSTEDGNNISLSRFDGAPFTDDTVINPANSISIGSHFCDKTFIVQVTGANVSASTTNVPENYTISDFASVNSVEPDEANGTIKFQFSDSTNGYAIADSTDLVDSELPDSTVMGYTFGSVDQDERYEEITVTIYQRVNGSDIGVHSEIISEFTIRDSGGGGRP